MTERATPVVFAIDVEPDDPEFPPGSAAPWIGFERCIGLVDDIRGRLTRVTGSPVRFSWFLRMDRQIEQGYGSATWGAERYAGEIDRLRQSGDEIGLHPHAWRWDEGASRWIADVGSAAWVEDCTRTSFEAYRQVFGERCLAHRAGDRFMSNGLLAVLRELDVRIDLTVEPGMRGLPTAPERPHTADLPDMALVPRVPYVPSQSDWRRPDTDAPDGGLLMLPLASADPGPLLGPLRAGCAKTAQRTARPTPTAASVGAKDGSTSLGHPRDRYSKRRADDARVRHAFARRARRHEPERPARQRQRTRASRAGEIARVRHR